MKPGTRIEIAGTPACGGFPGVAPEAATIAKPTARNRTPAPGYHLVRFANGGRLYIHESSFRVTDNR